jgi:hypothetical protein
VDEEDGEERRMDGGVDKGVGMTGAQRVGGWMIGEGVAVG